MASGPVFDGGSEGSLFERLRYNDYDRLTLSHLPPEEVVLFYEHRRLLSAIVTDPKMELRLPLQPGTMAVIHNHRVMHGRTAFTGRRGLCGCYIGDDEFRSVLRQLVSLSLSLSLSDSVYGCAVACARAWTARGQLWCRTDPARSVEHHQ